MVMQEAVINQGDTAWLIVATGLVALMTLPALALFYGGLTRAKSIINTLMMNAATYFIVSVVWVLWAYSLSFGPSKWGIIGGTEKFFMNGVGVKSVSGTIPEFVFCAFQLTFAAITTALISGSVVERMKFSAWFLFSILWVTFVYSPIAHWVWGGGFLANLGALDFAGGTVVHINAGMAGIALALVLGRRKEEGILPSQMPLVFLGGGLLLVGWFGFNAGSSLSASGLAGVALINTNTAASFGAVVWMVIEWIHRKKTTMLGAMSGLLAGLVGITPAAGFVNIGGALFIGFACAVLSYIAVVVVKKFFPWDDALDVFGIHGISGILGAILTGFFADPDINNAAGLLYGNFKQPLIQIFAVVVSMIYSFVMTFIIAKVLDVVVGLRVSEDEEEGGLDSSQHGEKAFNM
jgi:ammonium transporter, Amt family